MAAKSGPGIPILRLRTIGETNRPRSGSHSEAVSRAASRTSAFCACSKSWIPIDFIAGTSVGALVAATYASGTRSPKWSARGSETTFRDFGRWTLSRMGMASNERLEDYLHKFTPAQYFQRDENSAQHRRHRYYFRRIGSFHRGRIAPALRASCAYPGLFLPVERKDIWSMDF